MAEVFPPKVPCQGECAYQEECSAPGTMWGCGGCCGCLRACHQEHDVMAAYIPETPEQHAIRLRYPISYPEQ